MADRTSAALFGRIFHLLAENPTNEHKAIALKIWPETFKYDFSNYQMYADEALALLDLAKLDRDEDGEFYCYAETDGKFIE